MTGRSLWTPSGQIEGYRPHSGEGRIPAAIGAAGLAEVLPFPAKRTACEVAERVSEAERRTRRLAALAP
jgi:hypothetical protein